MLRKICHSMRVEKTPGRGSIQGHYDIMATEPMRNISRPYWVYAAYKASIMFMAHVWVRRSMASIIVSRLTLWF
jgi:hypothetical protein